MKKLFIFLFLLIYFLGASAQGNERPITWQEWLTNDGKPIKPGVATESKYMGDAETPWDDPNTRWNDQTKNYLICAWSKEKGRNMNEDDGWDPFPADIEVDPETPQNHIFVCHGQPATTEGDASAWDNQFFIESPRFWRAGEQLKIHFRYKASKNVRVDTQCGLQNPSHYLIWHAIGSISFTEKWQDFDGTMTIADDMDGAWSIAFNLNPEVKDAVDFYFDDLSWQSIVLDEGYFVAASNTETGDYDFDHAIEFKKDHFDKSLIVATVGEVGKQDTYVNRLMISTVRGNDASFKSYTLKPSGNYIGEDNWGEYTAGSNAKITLPSAGVWKIYLDTKNKQINILKIEGADIPPKPKCATPEICYSNGKITFSCETEGASYHYSITNDDCKTGSENNIQLCMTYKVYVYATKDGYNNSDVATREIVIENGQATLFGDINKDGKVNVADHVKLSDIIMNK